jgi:hypothetical protein
MLTLGGLVPVAHADPVQWRPVTYHLTPPGPASSQPAAALGPPRVALGKPVPLEADSDPQPIQDAQITRASFSPPTAALLRPVVRSQSPDTASYLPPPSGSTGAPGTGGLRDGSTWTVFAANSAAPSHPGGGEFASDTDPDGTAAAVGVTGFAAGCCSCEGVAGPGCDACARASRFYGGAEYLLWWIKDSDLPVLVTAGTVASQGILGQVGTTVLFGGDQHDNREFSGGRFTFGYWLDPCQSWGIEGNYFFLAQRSTGFAANSNEFPILARPFFNLNQGIEFAQETSGQRASGSIAIGLPVRLWGAEADVRCNLCTGCAYRVDLLGGFRYIDLAEGLDIVETTNVQPGVPVLGGNNFLVYDGFHTRNQFYGEQLGVDAEYRRGHWFVDFRGKVAVGVNHESLNIVGNELRTNAATGTPTLFQGGLLALPSNLGHFSRDHFAVVPEVGINFGYQVTDNVRAFVGYNFLYVSSVIRPGDQVDRVLDITQIPNFPVPGVQPTALGRPTVLFKEADFWAQGINLGVEIRY